MNFYEKEMRTMFAGNNLLHDARFCGKTMIGKLDDELRVKLQLFSTSVANQYDAVQATIINRKEGMVDQQTFLFSDVIGMQMRNNRDEITPHIWTYNGKTEWYISITNADRKQIAAAVLGYVEMYQEEGMEMGGMNL